MKKLYSCMFMAFAIFSILPVTAMEEIKGDKFIRRIKNNSNELSVAIAPYSDPLGLNIIPPDDAYVVTMRTDWDQHFDVPLKNAITMDPYGPESNLKIFVGNKSHDIKVNDYQAGDYVLIVNKQGNVSLKSTAEVEPAADNLDKLDPELFEGPVAHPDIGERNTYISRIINQSSTEVIHILPFRDSILSPTGTKGYTLSAAKPGWLNNINTNVNLFIGSDIQNSGVIIIAEGIDPLLITPNEFAELGDRNVLTIDEDDNITLSRMN